MIIFTIMLGYNKFQAFFGLSCALSIPVLCEGFFYLIFLVWSLVGPVT